MLLSMPHAQEIKLFLKKVIFFNVAFICVAFFSMIAHSSNAADSEYEVLNQIAQADLTKNTNEVIVKSRVKEGFAELNLAFPEKPVYTSAKIQDKLIISFTSPVNIDSTKIKEELKRFVKNVELRNDNKVFIFETFPKVETEIKPLNQEIFVIFKSTKVDDKETAKKNIEYENKINELKKQAANALTKDGKKIYEQDAAREDLIPSKQESENPLIVRVRTEIHNRLERLVFEWPANVTFSVHYDKRKVLIEFDAYARADLTELEHTPLKLIKHYEQGERDGKFYFKFWTPSFNRVESFQNKTASVVDIFHENRDIVKEEKTKAEMPKFPDLTWEERDQKNNPSLASKDLKPDFAGSVDGYSEKHLRIDAGGPASMAAFERAGRVFVLFDRYFDGKWSDIVTGSDKILKKIKPLKGEGWSGFMIENMSTSLPIIQRSLTVWTIDFSPSDLSRRKSILAKPDPDFGLGARFLIETQDAAQIFHFKDPDIGDEVTFIPLSMPSYAFSDFYKYPEFQMIPAFQGIVLKKIGQDVLVRSITDGVEISARDGLIMSQAEDLKIASAEVEIEEEDVVPVFDFGRWVLGPASDFTKNEQLLLKRIIEADEGQRGAHRMNLARFYFSHGYSQEALSVLRYIYEEDHSILSHPEFRALRGVAYLKTGHINQGWDDLNDPEIRENVEIGLWLGSITTNPYYASKLFYQGAVILDSYPDHLKLPLVMKAIESFVVTDSFHLADLYLETIHRMALRDKKLMPAYLFYKALILQNRGMLTEAKNLYEKNRQSRDRYFRARSKLAMIDVDKKLGDVSSKDLVDRLEQMMFSWRDDLFEVEVQRRLFEAYIENKDYTKALLKAREMITIFPDEIEVKYMPRKMANLFEGIFLEEEKYDIPAVEAFTIFENFSELTPIGEEGNLILQRLADRLVEVGLLEKAADLLEHQVRFRLEGKEKALIGGKLAAIFLSNDEPKESLEILDESDVYRQDLELNKNRKMLRAKALTELRDYKAALSLLKGDQSLEALMLKQEISWEGQEWRKAAHYLEQLIDLMTAKDRDNLMAIKDKDLLSKALIRRTLSLSMLNDLIGLSNVRDQYKDFMFQTDHGKVFNLITRPREFDLAKDPMDVRTRIGEIDLFDHVLNRYKKPAAAIK